MCFVCQLIGTGVGKLVWGSSALSDSSLVVDETGMRPGHWLGLVVYVSLSALTLFVG